MKVLLVAPRFFDAKFGEKRAVMSAYKTALALSKHVEVVVVTAGPPPRFEIVSDKLKIYRLWDLYLPDPVNYGIAPAIFWQLPKIVAKEKPDVHLVNKHMFFMSFAVPLLRLMGKRLVVQTDTFVGINWWPRNRLLWPLASLYAYTFGLLVLKSANLVILLHEGLMPVAKRLGLPYTVIHNGVDLDEFKKASPANDITKKSGEIFIAYTGRLESVKGYDDLLAVATRLVPKYPHVKFFFVGNTDGQEEIVKKFASERIIFTGHRADIPSMLKKMDIFVLPSYSEGLPNSLMEAMAAGCACLASDVGGIKVLLSEGEGLTFPPGDQSKLERELVKLIEDRNLRHNLGQKAAARIARDFDQDKEIVKLIRVLQNHD